jgi:hypothetical protein
MSLINQPMADQSPPACAIGWLHASRIVRARARLVDRAKRIQQVAQDRSNGPASVDRLKVGNHLPEIDVNISLELTGNFAHRRHPSLIQDLPP